MNIVVSYMNFTSCKTGYNECYGSDVKNKSISCFPRNYGEGNIVCVCNVTHCDNIEPISEDEMNPRTVHVIESNKDGARFKVSTLNANQLVQKSHADGVVIRINRNVTFQSLLGFGAAFTDAAGMTTTSLGPELTKLIIQNYWSSKGLQYTIGRIVIGGCDFSLRKYTYDDDADGDMDLNHFNLTQEDFDYKVNKIIFSFHHFQILFHPLSHKSSHSQLNKRIQIHDSILSFPSFSLCHWTHLKSFSTNFKKIDWSVFRISNSNQIAARHEIKISWMIFLIHGEYVYMTRVREVRERGIKMRKRGWERSWHKESKIIGQIPGYIFTPFKSTELDRI